MSKIPRLIKYLKPNSKLKMDSEKVDPGAVRWGNFINYYQFNPPDKRLCHLPKDLLSKIVTKSNDLILCLDVGSNAGDLTSSLHSHLSTTSERQTKILGVDLDEILVQISNEKFQNNSNISFKNLDLTKVASEEELKHFLKQFDREEFDVIFCFSVTMWIHLNSGDDGLRLFFERISKFAKSLILEPQPWKCYRTASRRMRKSKQPDFEKIDSLQHQGDQLLVFIDQLCKDVGFEKVLELGETHWSRPIWVYKKL